MPGMPDIIESLRRKHAIVASDDIVGVFGNPAHSLEFWRKATGDASVGLEVLAWINLPHFHPEVFQGSAENVGGYHGQTGKIPFDWGDIIESLLGPALNKMIIPNDELLPHIAPVAARRSGEQTYLLNHGPAAMKWLAQEDITLPPGVTHLIENHIDENAFDKALAAKQLSQEKGFRTEFVFDIVHSLRSRPHIKDYKENWAIMLAEFARAGRCLVHLPFGTNEGDSLHLDEVTPQMWKQLGKIIQRNDDYVIIEHQQGSLRKKFWANPTHKRNAPLLTRATHAVEMFREHNILPKVSRPLR
jgi:hypothetical protein